MHDNMLEPMQIVRDYCSLGHKLRQKYNIPVSYPLYEMRINVLDIPYSTDKKLTLLTEERQLIADELNIDFIEPVFNAPWSQYANVVTMQYGNYQIAVDITKDHHLDRRHEERKKHRDVMAERKRNAHTPN